MNIKLPRMFKDNFELREPTTEEVNYIKEQCSFYFLNRNHSVCGRIFVLFLMLLSMFFLVTSVIAYLFYHEAIAFFWMLIYVLVTISFVIGAVITSQKGIEKDNFKNNRFVVAESIMSDRLKYIRECYEDDSFVLANVRVFCQKRILKFNDVLVSEKLKTILEFQNVDEYPCLLVFVKDKPEIFAITKK